MGNHYHLLAETPEGNLVEGMKWLQAAYTQRYNGRHKVFGHLFQGRYKAVIVDGVDRMYLQVVSTYIHLNPARAKLIQIGEQPLKSYPWSSYPLYLSGSRTACSWLRRDRVLGTLGLSEKDGKGYEAYLESRVLELASQRGRKELEEKWKELRRGWYLGGSEFREQLEQRLEKVVAGKKRESHSGPARQTHDEASARKLIRWALKAFGLADGEGTCPKGCPRR